MKIGLLGGRGQIGSCFRRMIPPGYEIVDLLNREGLPFRLGDDPDLDQMSECESVVHLAWSRSGSTDENYRVNVEGSRALVAASRLVGTRFVFASSYSVSVSPLTQYAIQKGEIESMCDNQASRFFRIGLVWNDKELQEGVTGALSRVARIARVYPQPRSDEIFVHLAHVEDVASWLVRAATSNASAFQALPRDWAHPTPYSLHKVVEFVSRRPLRRVVISERFAEGLVRISSAAGLIGSGVDSLRGLSWSTTTSSTIIGDESFRPLVRL